MIKTEFFNDFIAYYDKAHVLEKKNLLLVPESYRTNDPIMDNVTIYDTVHRRYAGFSKALEDIHGVRSRKDLVRYGDFSKKLTSHQFHFLHLFHRFTGSGASFQPTILPDGTRNPKEHGYLNNHVERLANLMTEDFEKVQAYIVNCKEPMVTSVGNQPPSLKNGQPEKYRLAQQFYFDNYARDFINRYIIELVNEEYRLGGPMGIKQAVDFSLEWHKEQGFKQWHFVLTAFVMDTAEYYPELVDPNSHCYYGANAIRSMDLMFVKEKGDPKKKDAWYEACMTELVKAVNGKPYDIEDVLCDYIRYVTEYIPKGYDHLTPEQRLNNSTLKKQYAWGLDYPPEIAQRIREVIG